jgi:RNA polymerase sigma factor (sigma-70 family)
MATAPLQTVLHHLRRLVTPDGAGGLTDSQLVERFVAGRDEAAFEVLVWRHGAMVFDLCLRLLRHRQDAEDAFQATFLILSRKAGSIGKREAVGSWLYKVAYRVALGARAAAARRARLQRPLPDVPAPQERDPLQCDLKETLDEEVNRLPDKYRAPFILCYLEGKTVDEAARQLGRPRGTVGTWLARGRERLRHRLVRRGVALTSLALTAALARNAGAACVPAQLVSGTVRAAAGSAAAAGVVSSQVAALTEGVLRAMFVSKVKLVLGLVLSAALVTGAGGLTFGLYASGQEQETPRPALRARVADDEKKADKPGEKSAFKGWGSAIDPDGDCKFTVEKGKLTITVPGKDHDLGVERKRMNAPRVLREIEGDFIVQVKVSGTFKPVDPDTDQRAAFQGAGLLVLDDDNNYLRLERASFIRDGTTYHYGSWELRKNAEVENFASPSDYPIEDGTDVYLRIERHGENLHGAISKDGVTWNYVSPTKAVFEKKVKVGVAGVNTSKQEFTPQFSEFKLFREVEK